MIYFKDSRFHIMMETKREPVRIGSVCSNFFGNELIILNGKDMELGFIKYENELLGAKKSNLITPLLSTCQKNILACSHVPGSSSL
jgi:hypothetical protein